MKYEYAISAGPGTLVDVGDVYISPINGNAMTSSRLGLPIVSLGAFMKKGQTIIIGPVATKPKAKKGARK